MPPSADDKLIEDGVQDFSRGLHSDLPLRHFGEFHNQEELKKVVERQKENAIGIVFDKIWTREREEVIALVTKLNRRMEQEVIAEWVKKNREHEIQSVSFLQKWVDMICQNFNDALEYQLLLNPDMELESLKNCISAWKLIASNVFESIWKPGNAQMQEERKSKLDKQLQSLEDEVFEKHQRNLESMFVDKGKRFFGEVRSILLERSRQLKSYVVQRQGRVSTAILGERVKEISDYLLNGKGSSLKESHEEIFHKLVANFDGEIQFLEKMEKSKESMTAEDVIGYAERFDEKLRSCCVDNDNATVNTQEMKQSWSRRDPNEEAKRSIMMQELLKEIKTDQPDSLDLVEYERDGSTHESNGEGDNEGVKGVTNSIGDPRLSTNENETRRRASRRLKRSAKDTDFNDLRTTNGADAAATAPEVPPSTIQRTGCGVAKKIARRGNAGIQRRSLRQNQSTAITPSTSFNLRASKRSKVTQDSLEGSLQRPQRLKHVVSKKATKKASGRNGSQMTPSERRQINGSKLPTSRGICPSPSDAEDCPKCITIIGGDCPKYSCDVCKMKFRWKKYLKYHGEFCGVSKSKSFICDECSRGFHTQQYLVTHKQTHTGEKPFQCPQCPDRFTRKGSLQRHIRRHTKDSPHICKLCNLTLVSSRSLHEHNVASHEGVPLFGCGHCDKRYDQMSQLRNHVIFHAGERPFQCSKCQAAFNRYDNLHLHLQEVHRLQREMAQKLAYDAAVGYLLKETKNESFRDLPANRINAAVVNHVIEKAKLLLPDA